jgi:hypothetical protein
MEHGPKLRVGRHVGDTQVISMYVDVSLVPRYFSILHETVAEKWLRHGIPSFSNARKLSSKYLQTEVLLLYLVHLAVTFFRSGCHDPIDSLYPRAEIPNGTIQKLRLRSRDLLSQHIYYIFCTSKRNRLLHTGQIHPRSVNQKDKRSKPSLASHAVVTTTTT